MTALTLMSLLAGGLAATWKGASVDNSKRLEFLGGGLLATGFLLLGVGLHVVLVTKI